MKRTIALLLGSLILSSFLASCGGAQQTETTPPATASSPAEEITAQTVSPTEAAQKNPYFNDDYSVRFMKSKAPGSKLLEVYNDSMIFSYTGALMSWSFSPFDPEVHDGQLYELSPYEGLRPLCSDPTCDAWRYKWKDCPGIIKSDHAQYVIDAYESAGSYPILYITYPTDVVADYDEKGEWVSAHPTSSTVFRYDTAVNERKEFLKFENEIIRSFASYDDLLFYVAYDENSLNSVTIADKSGKKYAASGKFELELDLIGYHDGALYYADYTGNVYRLDKETGKDEKVFTAPDFMMFYMYPGTRMFIHGDYLYFDDAQWTEVNVINDYDAPQTWLHPIGNIYRLPLSDFSAEPQLVAEDVYDGFIYGIVGDEMYYGKFEMGEHDAYCNWDFIGSKIWKTNLNTLETALFKDDIHVMFVLPCSYFSERFCVGLMVSAVQRYKKSNETFMALYDFETGKLIELKKIVGSEFRAYWLGEEVD